MHVSQGGKGTRVWLVMGLIAFGVFARLVPHPWNVTPLTAIALFGGTFLTKRWSILLPLAVVAGSDLLIAWHHTVPFTWSAFALVGMIGWWIRRKPNASRIAGATLAGSTLFYLVTNFGVWAVGYYPQTSAGLWQCYVAGLPYFRNMVAGDLVYAAVLFGSYALVTGSLLARQTVSSR